MSKVFLYLNIKNFRVLSVCFYAGISIVALSLSACKSTNKVKSVDPEQTTPLLRSVEDEKSPKNLVDAPADLRNKIKTGPSDSPKKLADSKKISEKNTSDKVKVSKKVAIYKAPSLIDKPVSNLSIIKTKKEEEQPLSSTKDDYAYKIPLLNTLDDLPLILSDGWQLHYTKSPANGVKRCLLANESEQFDDGYKLTNIKVWLSDNGLELQSASNFDLSYPETGVYLLAKDGTQVSSLFTNLEQPTSIQTSFSDEFDLTRTAKILIKIGFWPSWPITKTTEVSFPFPHSKEIVNLQGKCNDLRASLSQ